MLTALRFIAIALLTISVPAQAAKFANQFTEFELPPQWSCNLEGAEWVCQSSVEAKKKDAIIVLAAKLKGDQDSLDQYRTYLDNAKAWTSVQGKPMRSEVKYPAKTVEINGQPWVDSLHSESELPGFYTRYLATVKVDIGVLITYSINKAKYQEYLSDFENMVKTLKVFRKAGGINAAPGSGNIFANLQVPQGVSEGTVFPGGDQAPAPKKKKADDTSTYMIGAAVAAVLFFIWKKRQNS